MRFRTISLFVVSAAIPAAFRAQQQVPRPEPQIVVVGQITRMDKITRSFELTSQDPNDPGNVLSGAISIGVTIGGSGPGPTSRGEPRLDPLGNPRPSDTGTTRRQEIRRTTIYFTDKTACRNRDKVILCSELKVTDRVTVKGSEALGVKQQGLNASEIARTL